MIKKLLEAFMIIWFVAITIGMVGIVSYAFLGGFNDRDSEAPYTR